MADTLRTSFLDRLVNKHGWFLLLALTALLYLPGSGTLPMMDRDEPRFAHATVEMMQRGSWAVPYFNNEYRFDKPPLTYWWMALHYRLMGVSELAARLHTIFSVWLVSLVLLRWGGFRAGLAWLVTFQVFVHGRLAVADMPMVLFVTLAMWALSELLKSPRAAWCGWHGLLYASLGLGFLAKGPIAWLVPGIGLILFRFAFWRKPVTWGAMKIIPGALVTLVIVAAWGVPALIQTNGAYWNIGMGEHVIDRGTRAFNGRLPLPGYYLVTALLSLFPWMALLPDVWRHVRKEWDVQQAFLVSWFAAPYLIFTLYATQLPHYVMPGFPAAILLMTQAKVKASGRWFWFVMGLWVLISIAATALAFGFHWPSGLGTVLRQGAMLVAAVTMMGFLLLKQYRAWIAMVLLVAWQCQEVSAAIRSVHAGAQLAMDVNASDRLVSCQFNEPSLVFHFDHAWKFTSKHRDLERELSKPETRFAIVLKREWTLAGLLKSSGATTDESKIVEALAARHAEFSAHTVEVFNAARSSWAELLVLQRGK